MAIVFKKQFTPQEANKRLPLVRQIVKEIVVKGKRLKKIMAKARSGTGLPTEGLEVQMQMKCLMQELEELGCFYKDWNFEVGLVDFPATIDGNQVFLCWSCDEKDIRYYHGIDEGYSSRQAIPQHLLN